MQQIFQPFTFTGSQINAAGGTLYVALFGGAGSGRFRSTSTYWYNNGVASGSGGLLLAKITGAAEADVFKVYVGGRGAVGDPRYFTTTNLGAGAAPKNTTTSQTRRDGSSAGAASALTLQVGGTAAEDFLLIAPSGGGGGGIYSASYVASLPSQIIGGHGTFDADLGRSGLVAGGTFSSGDQSRGPGGDFGSDVSATVAAQLLGGRGEEYQGNGFRRPGRGGGGAPNGAAGSTARSKLYSDGGGAGEGFIFGGPASGAANTIIETTYTSHGANITIEAIGFNGRTPLGPAATGNRGTIDDLKNWYDHETHANGVLVREITNALGWGTAASSAEIEWPPVLGDRSANALDSLSISDPSALARRPMRTFPGQASQRKKDNGSDLSGAKLLSAHPDTTNWHSNGGAAMLRLGADGACFGFEARDYRGGFSDSISADTTATRFLPTANSNDMSSTNIVGGGANALTATFGAAYGGDSATNAVAATFDFEDSMTALLSASSNTSVSDLLTGAIHPDQNGAGISSALMQVRDASAAVLSADLADASPAFAVTTDISGVEASAGSRQALAVNSDFGAAYTTGTATFVISDADATPTATARSLTGSALTAAARRGLTIDQYGYGYAADANGHVDVFEVEDSANSHPVVLAQQNVTVAAIDSLAYDPENDLLWASVANKVTPIAIVRDGDFAPTLLQDLDVGTSTQAARTLGTSGNDEKIFFGKSGTLIQQDSNALRLLDVSGALPNPAFITPNDAAGAGAYLSIGAAGDALDCNLTTGFPTNGMSFVVVVRAGSGTFQPFVYFDGGTLQASQVFGVSNSVTRVGQYEADLSPHHGRGLPTAISGIWSMIAFSVTGTAYRDTAVIGQDGVSGSAGSGGGSAAADVNDVSNFGVYLGSPSASFSGNNDFDIAFARIYDGNLTAAQSTQIWDHWAQRNAALYTANGQTSPTFTSGRADILTGLHAEWDFAKMRSNTLQTTQGNAGAVTASLVGSASFVS